MPGCKLGLRVPSKSEMTHAPKAIGCCGGGCGLAFFSPRYLDIVFAGLFGHVLKCGVAAFKLLCFLRLAVTQNDVEFPGCRFWICCETHPVVWVRHQLADHPF